MRAHVLLLGKGTVGGQLLLQLASTRSSLLRDHGIDIRLAGIADRRAQVVDPTGLDPGSARSRLVEATDEVDLGAALKRLAPLETPILVDCTAADDMEALYATAFRLGIHVVTANKKPLATSTEKRNALFATARESGAALRYETTVGASLPIIETLKNLVATGDRVHAIEGSFSGTLGFLVNEVSRGEALSTALRTARSRGYTEPHPRDDLAGTDVARKALILAREIGLVLEPSDVVTTPLVPAALFEPDDVERFFAGVAAHDAKFQQTITHLREDGCELRYLATITPGGEGGTADRPRVTVGPVGVREGHPARRLRGTESFVAFHSERYRDHPLVVQGPGAGGALTASGVLADVIAIARQVGRAPA
ncbi:MAG: hypothetical protein JST00_38090 [Deltaproteobacteria bacterium]|nr:hypothetical protein [Deltaproteobacteria bacterium]